MKVLILILAVLSFTGCGRFDRWWAGNFGNSESCIGGVKYIQFVSGASVKYNPNGTIATCN